MSNIEKTLSIIKPDAVERNLTDEIKKIFSIRAFQTTSIMRGETQMDLRLRFELDELMRELQSSRRFINPIYDSSTESLQVEFN